MASLSESNRGFAPEAPDREGERRERENPDESGARPLPREAYDAYEPYDADPLDEEVVLPGVSRHAGTFFGIGVGIGVALLFVVGGLYLGGYVSRSALGPSAEATSVTPDLAPFEEAARAESLAFARLAKAKLAAQPVMARTTEIESPDIQVIPELSVTPTPNQLTDDLKALDRAMPSSPVPRQPSNDEQAPERLPAPVPAPAEPTAPAETSAPENPY